MVESLRENKVFELGDKPLVDVLAHIFAHFCGERMGLRRVLRNPIGVSGSLSP